MAVLIMLTMMSAASQPCPIERARVFGMCQEPHTTQDIERLAGMGCDVIVRGISCAWAASPQQARERMASKARLLELSRQRKITFCTMITSSAIYPQAVPPGKVEQWASRDAHGRVIPTNTWHQGCLNNPEFRAFTRDIGRAVIDAGADGIHYDESYSRWFWMRPIPCFCDHCCEQLRKWLASHFTADQLRQRWGIKDVSTFDYRRYLAEHGWADEPWRSPLHPQWWLMQLNTTARWEKWIVEDNKRYARERYGREIVTNANQYMMATLSAAVAMESRIYDFVNIGTGLSLHYRDRQGAGHVPISPAEASLIPTYRMARAATPDKPVVVFLDIQQHPENLAALPQRDEGLYMQWLTAEAHLSGCYFALHYRFGNYEGPYQPQAKAGQFVKAHAAWYRDSAPMAQVAVLYSFPSQIWDMYALHWAPANDYPCHSSAYYGVCQALLRANVQWETVFIPDGTLFPGVLQAEQLKKYRVVIAPWVYCAREAEISALEEFVRQGGKLIVVGDLAAYGEGFEKRNPRLPEGLKRAVRVEADVAAACDPSRADVDDAVVRALIDRAGLVPQVMVGNPRARLQIHLRRSATGGQILVDVLNTDFSWLRGFRPSPPTQVFVKTSREVTSARLYTFDEPDGRKITVQSRGGVAAINLPPVKCYALVVLH